MLFDQTSLMLAIGFSGAALGVTLFIAWLSARSEQFLLGLTVGVVFLVLGVAVFGTYRDNYSSWLHLAGFVLLFIGFSAIWSSARQFRTGTAPVRPALMLALVVNVTVGIPFVLGFDGLGAILANIACAGLLAATAGEFWRSRGEAPVQVTVAAALYTITAISFALCALPLVLDGAMVLSGAPVNWAEELNAIVSIFALTGIGALSLALNQSRLARRHRSDAMTDPLTGLLNRRALFDRFGQETLAPPMAVLLCDLDHFKSINDRHGHAAGDDVLRQFAVTLRRAVRPDDVPARLGGEEFAVVLSGVTCAQAALVGERIRSEFAACSLETLAGRLACTVSVGVAACGEQPEGFETLLGQADAALYAAKRDGRNRVAVRSLQLVA